MIEIEQAIPRPADPEETPETVLADVDGWPTDPRDQVIKLENEFGFSPRDIGELSDCAPGALTSWVADPETQIRKTTAETIRELSAVVELLEPAFSSEEIRRIVRHPLGLLGGHTMAEVIMRRQPERAVALAERLATARLGRRNGHE